MESAHSPITRRAAVKLLTPEINLKLPSGAPLPGLNRDCFVILFAHIDVAATLFLSDEPESARLIFIVGWHQRRNSEGIRTSL